MTALRKWMNKIAEILSILSMAFLVLLVTWQVITRFILDDPSTITEQLARYVFVWVILLNAAYVFGKREHMSIRFLVDKMPAPARLTCDIITEVCTLAFMLAVMIGGGVMAVNVGMSQMDSALPVPMGAFYLIMPLSGVITTVYSILNILDIILDYRKGAAQ